MGVDVPVWGNWTTAQLLHVRKSHTLEMSPIQSFIFSQANAEWCKFWASFLIEEWETFPPEKAISGHEWTWKRGEGQDWESFWDLGSFPVLLIQPRLKVTIYWDPHLPMYPPVPRAAGPSSPLSLSLKGQGSWENPAKWELKMTKQLIRSEVTRMRNKSH